MFPGKTIQGLPSPPETVSLERARRAWPRQLLRTAAVVLITFAAGWATMTASAEAAPGDWLYPVKLFTERAQFFLTINPERKAELRIVFSAERLKEAVLRQKRGEGLDRTLLSKMIEEAKLAVQAGAAFPEPTRELLMARAAKLSEFQRDTLGRLKSQVTPEERPLVVEYMNMCGRRSMWMRRAKAPQSDPQREDSGGAAPLKPRVKRQMDSCPMKCD